LKVLWLNPFSLMIQVSLMIQDLPFSWKSKKRAG